MHCKSPIDEVLKLILRYADGISLAGDTAEKLRVAVTTMDATLLRRGVTISTKKTRVLVVSTNAAAQAADSVITLQGDQLEVVSFFKYLGSVFVSDCTLDAEITHQVAAANSASQQLRRDNIWDKDQQYLGTTAGHSCLELEPINVQVRNVGEIGPLAQRYQPVPLAAQVKGYV
ncbi:MAG: hypothetical protein FRX49_08768 [Trebouxia sp. A1-2]|nr:MAG: hypothetical protein FRX49_08768 [Trebouxia sp. A1-2]